MTAGLFLAILTLLGPQGIDGWILGRSTQDIKTTTTIITRAMEGQSFELSMLPTHINEVNKIYQTLRKRMRGGGGGP